MPRFVMEGFLVDFSGIGSGGSFDLDVTQANLVLNTSSATTITYEYTTFQSIDVNLSGGFTLKLAGQTLAPGDYELGFAQVKWGAGLSTQIFGGEFLGDSAFYAPVRGDRMPNLNGDKGHVALEFFEMVDLTGTVRKVKSGPFAEGETVQLRDLFQDNTSSPFKQGKNDSERLLGGAQDNLIVAQGGADEVLGKGGADTLLLGRGNDKGYGGSGGDVISGYIGDDRIWGESGSDKLYGGLFDDRLYGGSGKDQLFGGTDKDRLDGGQGNDKLKGGSGADSFVFQIKGDTDRIKDFGRGQDRLKLDDKLFGNISEQQVVNRYAEKTGGNIVFDFGSGDKLILEDYTKLGTLADFIDII